MGLETNVERGRKTKEERRTCDVELRGRRRGNNKGMGIRKVNTSGPGEKCEKRKEDKGRGEDLRYGIKGEKKRKQ